MTEHDLIKEAESPETLLNAERLDRWELLPALFRVKGKPFCLKGREQFSVLFDKEMVRETIVLSGRQLGKCFQVGRNNLVDCYGRPLKDPKPGDRVLSMDGWKVVPGTISNVFPSGRKRILRITTACGNEITVSPDHKIRVFDGYVPAGSLSVGDRLVTMRQGGIFGSYTPENGRIEATAYMLGDGSTSSKDMNFTSMCRQALDEIEAISGPATYREEQKAGQRAKTVNFLRYTRIPAWMVEDGLLGLHSYDKRIPDWVFSLSRDDTRLFVSRLWATDGRVSSDRRGRPDISYCTTSKELCRGVRSILFKLGYMNTVRVKPSFYRKPDGARKRCRDAYIIRIATHESAVSFLSEIDVPGRPARVLAETVRNNNRDTVPKGCNELIRSLFRTVVRNRTGDSLYGANLRRTLKYPLTRGKLDAYLEHARRLGLEDAPEFSELQAIRDGEAYFDSVRSIVAEDPADCIDIEVSGLHNFMLDNVCVHNSMSLSRSEIFNLLSIPEFQLLYVAPLQEQTRRYSDLYITEAIQSCSLAQQLQKSEMKGVLSDAKIIQATGHQTFANGSGLQLTYAKTSADRARGIMADMIDFDEIQDQSGDTVPIIQESLTSSERFGCSRYTGTAKVVENLIEAKWQKSAQCEWVMKCRHCNYHNIPNMDGKVLNMIQADGMHCLHCGRKLDVSDGQWIAAYPDRMKSFRGYHIPQVVCPFIVDNRNNWDKLLHKLMNGVLATFIQENLGISYSVGQRLLTQADIVRQSCLPDMKTLQDSLDRYSYTVAGIDWGGSELQSFTVVTVVGIRPDGRIDCIYAKRYRGFDPDDQLVDIAKVCRFYGVSAVAADLGMGMDKNLILVKRFGLPVVQMMYTRQNKLFGKNRSNGATSRVQCWTIDKVMALDVLFMSIKNGRIFFPKTGLESFTPDLLSPYESTTEAGGMEHRIYLRSEGQPDDFCHALCFGSMAAMKLMGMDVDDMIPETAFGRGMVSGRPDDNFVNPYEE